MKRTSLKRKTPLRARSLLKPSLRAKVGKKVSIWKKARPKSTPIRASARGEECTIRLPMVCNGNPETTALCHSNLLADGKGMGLKAPDTRAAYGCSACHDVLDGRASRPSGWTYEMVLERFEVAIERTQAILRMKGLLT